MKLIKVFALYVVPILVLALMAYSFLFERQQMSLSYTVEVSSNVVSENTNIEDIKVYFQGVKIDTMYVHRISIKNDGNVPIRKDSFSNNLMINYGGGVLYHTRLHDANPSYLPVDITAQDGSVSISPLLLNPNDMLQIDVYHSNRNIPEVQVRIEGIEDIKFISNAEDHYDSTTILLTVSAIISFIYGAYLYAGIVKAWFVPGGFSAIGLSFIGTCIMLISQRFISYTYPEWRDDISLIALICSIVFLLFKAVTSYRESRAKTVS